MNRYYIDLRFFDKNEIEEAKRYLENNDYSCTSNIKNYSSLFIRPRLKKFSLVSKYFISLNEDINIHSISDSNNIIELIQTILLESLLDG